LTGERRGVPIPDPLNGFPLLRAKVCHAPTIAALP
jgi:hypothetical protein